MDRGSLRALRRFNNVGYTLGFFPYKFEVLSHSEQVEDASSLQLELSPVPGEQGDNIESGQKDGRKIRTLGGRIQENNESGWGENEDFYIMWKFGEGTRVRWWLFVFQMGLQFVYECFLIFRSVQMYFDENALEKDQISVYYLSTTPILLGFFQLQWIKEYDQIYVCLNAVRDTVAHIRRMEPVDGRGEPGDQRSVKVFCYSALSLGIFITTFRTLQVFTSPGNFLVITSLAEDPKNLPLFLRLLAAAFHFHVAGFSAFCSWWFGLTLPWYVASILPVIEQKRSDSNSADTQDFIYKSYNMLSVLQAHCGKVYGNVALAMEMGCLVITIFNLFQAVVHRSFTSLVKGCVIWYLQNNFFSRMGEIHAASSGAIETWKRGSNGQVTWFTKFHRSVRPLRIYIGSFFFVDESFVLTLASIILDQSINLILSYE